MPSRDQLQTFQTAWNQTAAWAQSRGVKYDQYYPIYQQDSQRLLQYGSGMSQAEREQAIAAVANIGNASQLTPSTAGNPANVIGNTVTDLRNIFTGIGDIVIHPLHNGLVDSLKNTFDLIDGSHHLEGSSGIEQFGNLLTSTVLSWIPGVSDVGTVLQAGGLMAGLEQLAEHPVNSILDVLPIAKPFALGESAARLGDAAALEKYGMNVADLKKATVGRVVKGYVLHRPTDKMGMGVKGLTTAMTYGDRFNAMLAKSFVKGGQAIKDAMFGWETMQSHATTEERMVWSQAEESTRNLNEEQQGALANIFDTTKTEPTYARIDKETDPQVRQAALDLMNGPLRFHREELLAAKEITLVQHPVTGQWRIYSTTGHDSVIKARDAYTEATRKMAELLPGFEQLLDEQVKLEAKSGEVAASLTQANSQAQHVMLPDNFTVPVPGAPKRNLGLSKNSMTKRLFGPDGKVDSLVTMMNERKWGDVAELAKTLDKALEGWSHTGGVDAAADPTFQQVHALVKQAHALAEQSTKHQNELEKAVDGKRSTQKDDQKARTQDQNSEKRALASLQARERASHTNDWRKARDKLHRTYVVQRRVINNKWVTRWKEDQQKLADATTEIKQRYVRLVQEAKHAHDEARYNYVWRQAEHRATIDPATGKGGVVPTTLEERMRYGFHPKPGDMGSAEGEKAQLAQLTAQRDTELLAAQRMYHPHAWYKQQSKLEQADSGRAEAVMQKQLKGKYDKFATYVAAKHAADLAVVQERHARASEYYGALGKALSEWHNTRRQFTQAVWDHPPDVFNDVYFSILSKHLLQSEESHKLIQAAEQATAEKWKWGDEQISRMRANEELLGQVVQAGLRGTLDHPVFSDMDPAIYEACQKSAKEEIARLNREGIDIAYVPHVSTTQINAERTGSYGIRFLIGKGVPKPDAASSRTWDLAQSRFDIMAGMHRGVKQVLQRDAMIDYVNTYLAPRVVTEQQVLDTIGEYYKDELSGLQTDQKALMDAVNGHIKDMNLVEFDPHAMFSFRLPRFGTGKVYMDKNLADALQQMSDRNDLFGEGALEKGTKLFRYSILGLSPRYTAHIVFGGTFLLALRSSPAAFTLLRQAHDLVASGQVPEELLSATSTNIGTTEYALAQHDYAGGLTIGRLLKEHHIEKIQGITRSAAKPLHYLKAAADINLRFTSYITNLQRTVAYLDGAANAMKIEGMTHERAMYEGMHHAEQVMGDLRRMSPFERKIARTIVPFYGWQHHVLKYVLSFPGDHPWRAMMLAQMAEFDSEHADQGLPSRWQFLFFLGQPDKQGNVDALDLRALNPLRDVANYATLSGVISSLNPILTAPAVMVDPSITFGGNELYPNVTYDQFYGVETAPAQGNILNAIESVVPQVTAIQSAMKVAAARRGMNTQSLVKNIYESLNIPMFDVQHLNLNQEAARTALARYQVTKQLAADAWQTGDFSKIANLGSVPDPRNPDYTTSVQTLQDLWNTLAKQYPGSSPADVATPLPNLRL